MLSEYLCSAQNDLSAKQDIMQVKAQRLALAQDEYHHLNTTLTNLFSSRSSVRHNSSGSGAGRYDTDLLKADVALARSRVSRLKRELHQIKHEVANTEARHADIGTSSRKVEWFNHTLQYRAGTSYCCRAEKHRRIFTSGRKGES
ncbi:protein kibra-like [Macrobrachium nipponense]|uniref:protein kibra-like n=1 Tax=Macrobrachium nipponense TaxID=159736 RepID=UPI0030C7F312